jgi:nicotinamidase-related amidase
MSYLADGLTQPSSILISKRQSGAFYDTDLDLQLRGRGIKTIVFGSIAAVVGVESTARQAWEYGYDLVITEDATSPSARAANMVFTADRSSIGL